MRRPTDAVPGEPGRPSRDLSAGEHAPIGPGPHIEAVLAELRLPGPAELRLDPLRYRLDRRRVVAIHRLAVCGVPDAEPLGQGGDGAPG